MDIHEGVESIKGVGRNTAVLFRKMGVETVEDLLYFYPRTYLRYEEPVPIQEAEIGVRVTVKGTVSSYVEVKKVKSLTLVTCTVRDGSGSLKLVWYNSPFLKKVFQIGQTYYFVGSLSVRKGQLVMEHPEYFTGQQYDRLRESLQPVYPLTGGLGNKTVKRAVTGAMPFLEQLEDKVPEQIRNTYGLIPLIEAVRGSHFPESMQQLTECRRRLIFDEFFWFLVRMRSMREKMIRADNRFPVTDWSAVDQRMEELPFDLTNGQREALREIRADLSGTGVMNRLVQGDVGSGKTLVAELSMLAVVKNGYQAALMVPTEVLAMQHFEGIRRNLEPLGVRVEFLCGSTKLSEKRRIYQKLEAGEIDIVIGTHALIQDKVRYRKLGLVVTDEQHRFGVRQRTMLQEKGQEPHVLVMSATPIPRTLAIILYGDLDISVMKDMPAKRKPIKNCVVGPKYRPTAYSFMADRIREGEQIYIICPMVEAGEKLDVENVTEYSESLVDVFPKEVRIAALHGKMTADEKNEIMQAFIHREIDILVSTTVIEVGIDNPNATVILIENAERFGLAQLHQLRGRVGRGEAQSYCIMLCASDSKEVLNRLEILNSSNDGFEIANEDLKLRGPGDFFGVRQSGELLFQLGDIYQNADILKQANDALDMLEREGVELAEGVPEEKIRL